MDLDSTVEKRTILSSGQGWILLTQLGQLKTGLGGKELSQSHLWCSNDLARSWDRLDWTKIMV